MDNPHAGSVNLIQIRLRYSCAENYNKTLAKPSFPDLKIRFPPDQCIQVADADLFQRCKPHHISP